MPKKCDQYLVFNNIVEMVKDKEGIRGLLIKISDGMKCPFKVTFLYVMELRFVKNSFTGKLCPLEDIYGIHFGLSMPTLTFF